MKNIKKIYCNREKSNKSSITSTLEVSIRLQQTRVIPSAFQISPIGFPSCFIALNRSYFELISFPHVKQRTGIIMLMKST